MSEDDIDELLNRLDQFEDKLGGIWMCLLIIMLVFIVDSFLFFGR